MYYEVLPLYQCGIRRPRADYQRADRYHADVHIRVEEFGPLGRPSLMAYLFDQVTPSVRVYTDPDKPPLPPLYEVQMDGMATLGFVIRGVEFVDKRMYQQEWHCRAPAGTFTVPWRLCPRGPLDELI